MTHSNPFINFCWVDDTDNIKVLASLIIERTRSYGVVINEAMLFLGDSSNSPFSEFSLFSEL